MKTLLVVLPVLVLAGCATNRFDKELTGLVGKNVDSVVARLGTPTAQRQVGDLREVEWISARSAFALAPGNPSDGGFNLPRTVTFTPPVSQPWGGLPAPRAYESTAPALRSATRFCKLTLQVDSRNVIHGYRQDGDFDGCDPYARALGSRA